MDNNNHIIKRNMNNLGEDSLLKQRKIKKNSKINESNETKNKNKIKENHAITKNEKYLKNYNKRVLNFIENMIQSPVKIIDYDRNKPDYLTNKIKSSSMPKISSTNIKIKDRKFEDNQNLGIDFKISEFIEPLERKKLPNINQNFNEKENKHKLYFIAVKSINKLSNHPNYSKIKDNKNKENNENLDGEQPKEDYKNSNNSSYYSSSNEFQLKEDNIKVCNSGKKFKQLNKPSHQLRLQKSNENYKKNIFDIQTNAYNDVLKIKSYENSNSIKEKSSSNKNIKLIGNDNKNIDMEIIDKVKRNINFKEMQMKQFIFKEKKYRLFFENLKLISYNKLNENNILNKTNTNKNRITVNKDDRIKFNKEGKYNKCETKTNKSNFSKYLNTNLDYRDIIHIFEEIKKSQFSNSKKSNIHSKNEGSLDNTPRLLFLAKDYVLEKCNITKKKFLN